MADFLADYSSLEIGTEQSVELGIYGVEKGPWILKFDGSSIENSVGTGIAIVSPRGVKITLSFNLAFECTNNQAKYEALVISLEILLDLRVKDVRVIGDSQLVLIGIFCFVLRICRKCQKSAYSVQVYVCQVIKCT